MVVALSAAVLMLTITWLFKPVKDFIILTKIPHPKDSFILGNISSLSPNQHRLFLDYARQLGGVFALRILWSQVCSVTTSYMAMVTYLSYVALTCTELQHS